MQCRKFTVSVLISIYKFDTCISFIFIADMRTTDFAYEEPVNAGATVDSVSLRVMTHQDGCTCEVSLENRYNSCSVFMRKYDLLSSAQSMTKTRMQKIKDFQTIFKAGK